MPTLTAITAQAHHDTPLGRVLLARTDTGLAGLWFEGQKWHPEPFAAPERPDDPLMCEAAAQLTAYFAGQRTGFELPLALQGSAFQRSVWAALCEIACGQTQTYTDVARRIGAPAAVRAVGAAIGRNPLCVIVPCHRVVGSSGQLTGYAGGLARKRALLDLEATHAARVLEAV